MIPVDIYKNHYSIRNINSDDLLKVYELIVSDENNLSIIGSNKQYDLDTLKERYLETLINTFEFFCGIFYEKELIGIFKGRIENKNGLELWILTFILHKDYRDKGIGSSLIRNIEDYFKENYDIDRYYAVIASENQKSKNFWFVNGYRLERESYYLKINNRPVQILIKIRGEKNESKY